MNDQHTPAPVAQATPPRRYTAVYRGVSINVLIWANALLGGAYL